MTAAGAWEIALELARQARAGKPVAMAVMALVAAMLLVTSMTILSWMLASRDALCAVQGHVTILGEPIASGEVMFNPGDGAAGQRRSALIAGGAYSLPLARGLLRNQKYVVEIRAMRPTGRRYRSQGQEVDELEQFLPSRFNTASELEARPTSTRYQLDYDLSP